MMRRLRPSFSRLPLLALRPAALGLGGFAGALLLRRRRRRDAAASEATQADGSGTAQSPRPVRRGYYRKRRRFLS